MREKVRNIISRLAIQQPKKGKTAETNARGQLSVLEGKGEKEI